MKNRRMKLPKWLATSFVENRPKMSAAIGQIGALLIQTKLSSISGEAMTDKLADLEAKAETAKRVAPGKWENDTTDNEGEYGSGYDCHKGFKSYNISCDKGVIFDTVNSDVTCIEVECDEDETYAYDDVARKVTAFIAAADPETILSLIASQRALEARVRELREALKPFEAFNETLKEWWHGKGEYRERTQSQWPKHDPVLSRTHPVDDMTIKRVSLYATDFARAAAAMENKNG